MTTEDPIVDALRKENSELKLRVKELEDEAGDLRGICDENGLPYKEKLSRFQLSIRKMQTYAAR